MPSAKARSSIKTRNRLTNEPNMTTQHKTGPESCQAAVRPTDRTPQRMVSICPESRWAAAFCRRAAMTLLILLAYSIAAPGVLAGSSDQGSGSLRTEGISAKRIAYPPGTPFNPAFAVEPIDVYEDTVTIAATFPPGALDRAHDLRFTLTAQACTTQICLPPDDISGRATW